jgi:DedD protein
MPRVDSRDKKGFALRHRIVGALVLLVCAVVFLPLILRGPDSDQRTDTTESAPNPAGPLPEGFVSKVLPVPREFNDPAAPTLDNIDLIVKTDMKTSAPAAPATQAPKPAETPAAIAKVDTTKTGTTKVDLAKADVTKSADTAPQKPKTSTPVQPASTVTRGWVVQVGTYGKPENVKRMVEQLKGKGYSARTTPVKTDQGELTRVWVGPYEQRVQAGRAQSEIKRVVGAKGLIVAYP